MKNQDWKLKYQDLKLKFHDAVDTAFRLGYEQGAQGAQLQQMQQDQATAAAAQAGQPGQDPNAQPGQEVPGQQQSDGSELDQHIQQLESMVKQPGLEPAAQDSLQKSLNGIKEFQFNLKQSSDLKKSEKAIAAIAKAMKPVLNLGKAATKNMSEPAKIALNMQEKIVADVMKSMEEEEKKVADSITKTLSLEQLIKA